MMTYRFNIGDDVKVGNNTDTIFSVDDRFTDKDTGRNMYYLTIKNKKGSLLKALESSLRLAEDYNPNKTEPSYPPTLDEIAINEYKKTYNQKQKKGIKQVMSRLFEMCEGWLDPDKKEIVKAFMDTTYGTINFEHPKLQQYLIEQWAADKKMVALAKQVNEEKETK